MRLSLCSPSSSAFIAVLASCSAVVVHAAAALDSSLSSWHHPRIGVPLLSTLTSAHNYVSPRFHRIAPTNPPSDFKSQTAIYFAGDKGAIGALNPRNGDIVWRSVLDESERIQAFYLTQDVGLYLTGTDSTRATLRHALTGKALWSHRLTTPGTGNHTVPEWAGPGCEAAFVANGAATGDTIVLDGARRLTRLSGANGLPVWKWDAKAVLSSEHSAIVRFIDTPDAVFAIELSPSHSNIPILGKALPTSYSMRVHALSPATGALLATHDISGASLHAPAKLAEGWGGLARGGAAADVALLSLGATRQHAGDSTPAGARAPLAAHAVWLQKDGTIRAAPLVPEAGGAATVHTLKAQASHYIAIREVSMSERGLLIGVREDGHGEVIKIDYAEGKEGRNGKSVLKMAWEFEEDAKDAVYAGTFDKRGGAYINRVFFSSGQHLLNFHTFWADANAAQGQVTGFSFQYDHDLHGDVVAAPFEVSPVSAFQLITRSTFVTASGSLRMVQEDRHQWIREEGLAHTAAAVLVDLPVRKLSSGDANSTDVAARLDAAAARAVLQGENFLERLQRHALALRLAPAWLYALAHDSITGLSQLSFDPRVITQAAQKPAAAPASNAPAPKATASAPPKKHPAGGVAAAEVIRQPHEFPPGIPPHGAGYRRETKSKPANAGPPPPSSLAPRIAPANVTAQLFRDKLGLRKVLVSATTCGKVYAMDTDTKQYVWEKSLVGYGAGEGELRPDVQIKLLSVVRPVGGGAASASATSTAASDEEALAAAQLGPLISIVAEVTEKGTTITRVWEIDPLSGEFALGEKADAGVPFVVGRVKDAFVLPVEDETTGQKAIATVDQHDKLRIWPETPSVIDGFTAIATSFYFTTQEPASSDGSAPARLVGHAVLSAATLTSTPVWQLPFAAGEEIVSVTQATADVVASQGKVLGDRATMYKFLNPHSLLVLTRSAAQGSANALVVDGVTGAVLFSARLADGALSPNVPLHAAFVENWLTVTYSVDLPAATDAPVRSETRLLSVELYDASTAADQKWNWVGRRSSFALSGSEAGVRAFAQTFVLPWGVRALSTSRTKFGITSKSLLVATSADTLVALPRRLLDPRRPMGRKPNAHESEEGLMAFDAYIQNAPAFNVGGNYRLEGAHGIIAAPAMIESTSLVYVLGLDALLARVSPSGTFDILSASFNKAQLLLTITALSVGLLVAKPLVAAKQLKARW